MARPPSRRCRSSWRPARRTTGRSRATGRRRARGAARRAPWSPWASFGISGRTRPSKGAAVKGIILAGGTGSRLFPLTKVTNKHLLPVGKEPMIFHPVRKLIEAGIDEILIVTGVDHMGDVVNLLGSGKEFGCRFTYKVQDEAGGIAQALGLAECFAGQDPMCVILGDNIF